MAQSSKKNVTRKIARKTTKKVVEKAAKKTVNKPQSRKKNISHAVKKEHLVAEPISSERLLQINKAQEVAMKAVQDAVYDSTQFIASSNSVTASHVAVSEAIASAQAAVVAAVQNSAQDTNY